MSLPILQIKRRNKNTDLEYSTGNQLNGLIEGELGYNYYDNGLWIGPQGSADGKDFSILINPNHRLSSVSWINGSANGPQLQLIDYDERDKTSKTIKTVAFPSASQSKSGVVTTGEQWFRGTKHFDSGSDGTTPEANIAIKTNGSVMAVDDTDKNLVSFIYASSIGTTGDFIWTPYNDTHLGTVSTILHMDSSGKFKTATPTEAVFAGLKVGGDLTTANNELKHSNTITASTVKNTTTGTVAFGDSFAVPSITYDKHGHITSTTTTSVTLPIQTWDGITGKPTYYDAKAIKSITRNGTTFTYTCLDGTTGTFTQKDDNTTYSEATATAYGLVKIGYSTNNKNYAVQLDSNGKMYVNVPWVDTNTTYSKATADALGLVKIGYSTSGKNYAVQLDSNGKMYVNVPWTDNNTTYSEATSSNYGLVKIGYSTSGKNYAVQLDGGKMYVNVPWTDTDTDTKNTAGATNTSSKIYLIGATAQENHPQTYSHDTAYVGTDGHLYSNSSKVLSLAYAPEAYLTWGGKNLAGDITPIDMAMSGIHSANRLAFGKAEGITVEYSTDGTTWTDYGLSSDDKINLVSGIGTSLSIGKRTSSTTINDKLRITLTATSMGVYTRMKKILINITTNYAKGSNVIIEKAMKGSETTFSTVGTYSLSGWSGWNSIPLDAAFGGGATQTSNIAVLRFTFGITGVDSNTSRNSALQVLDMAIHGATYWAYNSNMAKTGHLYSWDAAQNARFPADVKATTFRGDLDGTATKANSVTGTEGASDIARSVWFGTSASVEKMGFSSKFTYNPATDTLKVGQVDGNAKTATNVAWSGITSKPSYYDAKAIKSITRSGTTFTYTCLDGTTGTFTQQDSNTTYGEATSSAYGLVKIGYSSSGKNYAVQLDGGKMYVNVPWSNTTYSQATADTLGLVKIGYTTSGKNYAVQLNDSGQMYVNVPWTDTDTNTNTSHAHTAGTGLTISGSGGTSGTTTYSANLNSTSSLGTIGSTSKLYAVGVDANGKLCVSVPWTDSNTTYSEATATAYGLVKIGYTTSGKNYAVQLDGGKMYVNVPWTDTNTTYSQATSSTLGLVKIGYSASGKNYAVQLNSSGQMYVNVPWTDTNTDTNTSHAHTAGTGLTISGSGGTSGTTTYSANLNSTTSLGTIGTTSKLYAVGVDANGKLCVSVPWTDTDTNTTYSEATSSTYGLVKIGYSTSGKNYAVQLSNGQMYVNVPWVNTTYSQATADTLGLVKIGYSASGKNYAVQLDSNGKMYVNVPWSDTNTTYSEATSTTYGLVKIGYTSSGKNYAVQLSNGQMYVNVPWSDTNTNTAHSHSAGTGLTISGSGGTSGTTTYSANLNSTTSLGTIGSTSKLYAVGVDANGKLCVSVPWTDTNTDTNTNYYHTPDHSSGKKIGTGVGVADLYVPQVDSTSASAFSTGTSFVTERDAYYATASINGARPTSSVGIYAPTSVGTSGYILKSNGSGAPSWLQILPIANGGTGLSSSPSMLVNLGSTTAASILAASPRPGVTGTLGVANGGTGRTAWGAANRIVYTSSSTALTYTGSIYISDTAIQPTSGGAASLGTSTYYWSAVHANYFNATSDIRKKKDISKYVCAGDVLSLPVYRFKYRDSKDNKERIGCMAQDLQLICPEIVHADEEGYLSIEESKIVYLLLEKMKEMQKEIDALKGEVI